MISGLTIRNIWKNFGMQAVLRGISIDVPAHSITALLGPSGCGKSTLLRIISGLETPDQGEISIGSQVINSVPVYKRGFGFMFQDWALFPHRNVAENIAFGLRMQQRSRTFIRERVAEMLDLVDLHGYAQRSIFELSGGQKQRVALARALAPNPAVLLLDEPLSSLDRTLRESLMSEVHSIIKASSVTAIYVTHDQAEAFTLADQVVVMQAGTVAQVGTPQAIYTQPATPFVAQFLSLNNLFPCISLRALSQGYIAQTLLGPLQVTMAPPPDAAWVLIRPEAVYQGSKNQITGTIEHMVFRGGTFRIVLRINDAAVLELDMVPNQGIHEGQTLSVALNPHAISFVPNHESTPSALVS